MSYHIDKQELAQIYDFQLDENDIKIVLESLSIVATGKDKAGWTELTAEATCIWDVHNYVKSMYLKQKGNT